MTSETSEKTIFLRFYFTPCYPNAHGVVMGNIFKVKYLAED